MVMYVKCNTKAHSRYHCCVSVCSLSYSARKVHVPYCHLLPVRLNLIHPLYLTNGTIFGKNLLNIKFVF